MFDSFHPYLCLEPTGERNSQEMALSKKINYIVLKRPICQKTPTWQSEIFDQVFLTVDEIFVNYIFPDKISSTYQNHRKKGFFVTPNDKQI